MTDKSDKSGIDSASKVSSPLLATGSHSNLLKLILFFSWLTGWKIDRFFCSTNCSYFPVRTCSWNSLIPQPCTQISPGLFGIYRITKIDFKLTRRSFLDAENKNVTNFIRKSKKELNPSRENNQKVVYLNLAQNDRAKLRGAKLSVKIPKNLFRRLFWAFLTRSFASLF